MINFSHSGTRGNISTKGVGPIANGLRRILLDELTVFAFDTVESELETNDAYITFDLLRVICFVRLLDPFENPGGEYHLKLNNPSNEPIPITSQHIRDTKTGDLIKFAEPWEIGTLSPKCSISITKIRTVAGTGRENARFSPVFGPVTYRPTDIRFVYYLNEKGRIEDDLRAIPTAKIGKEFNAEKLCTNILIWNEAWAQKMSTEDRELAQSLQRMTYDGPFCFSELSDALDYDITFSAHNPQKTFERVLAKLREDIQAPELTITAGEIIRFFCMRELECPIFGNFSGNNYRITIKHVDEKKIRANAVSAILKIIS